MAIPIISRTNTIDEWRIQTNQSATSHNTLETGNYEKSNGQLLLSNTASLIITSSGTSLQVSNNALIQGSATVRTDLFVGISDTPIGNAQIAGILTVRGTGTGLQVSNNASVNAELRVARTIYTGNVSANGNVTVANNQSIGGTLRLNGSGDVLYVNTGIAKIDTIVSTDLYTSNLESSFADIDEEVVGVSDIGLATITTGTVITGNVVNLTSNVAAINTITSTTGTVANLNSTTARITTGTVITGNVVNLSSNVAAINTATVTNGTVTNLNSTTAGITGATIGTAGITTATITTGTVITGNVVNLTSNVAAVNTITSTTGTVTNLNSTTAGITTATIGTAGITTATVTTGTVITGNVVNLTSNVASINTATILSGNVRTLSSNVASINTATVITGTVTNLNSTTATITTANATTLNATTGTIGALNVTGNTNSGNVNATNVVRAGQIVATSTGQFGSLNVTANTTSGNISTTGIVRTSDLSVTNTIISSVLVSGATTLGNTAVVGNLEVSGDFVLVGNTRIDSNELLLRSEIPQPFGSGFSYLGVNRGANNNSYIRWNEPSRHWDLRDVDNSNDATAYTRILTSNTISSSLLSVSDATLATSNTANILFRMSTVTGTVANSALFHATAGYTQANTATTNAATADQRAVTSGSYANSAFVRANTADQRAVTSGVYANSAYTQANTATTNAATADQRAVTSGAYANSAYIHANSAFTSSNTKLNSSGGTISGNLSVTGNLTVSGTTTYINSNQLNIGDNIITLNADLAPTSTPSENAGIEINRGTSALVQLRWNEDVDRWQFTNDGTNFSNIATAQAEIVANAAFNQANTATTNAATADQRAVTSGSYANSSFARANTNANNIVIVGSYANSAYIHANAAFSFANSANTNLTNSISTANSSLKLYVDGLVQNTNSYSTLYTNSNISANVSIINGSITSNVSTLNSSIASKVASVSGTSGRILSTGGTTPQIDLVQTGVFQGTYGANNAIPVINVDSYGRITGVTNVEVSATTLTGILPISNGGTGASDAGQVLNNFLPSGEVAGYVLTTGGEGTYYWAAGGGGGGGSVGTAINTARTSHVATSGQTLFSTPTYLPGAGQLRVYINGVRQFPSEYTETDSTSVTLSSGASVNDVVFVEVDGFVDYSYSANTISFTSPFGSIPEAANTVQLAIQDVEARKATIASPAFTGTPTAPTAAVSTSNTMIATTAFVSGQFNTTTKEVSFGSLGVGVAASANTGEIRATGTITAYYSDERLKTNLGPIEDALDKVKSLNGFYHEANEIAQELGYEKIREVGVSAQEVEKVMPEVVAPAPIDDKYLTVRYERLVPLLIEAIKELNNKVEQLEQQVNRNDN